MGENYGPSIGEIFLTITQDTKVVRENSNNLTSSRTGCRTGDWFQIGKGVHQGCVLSPCLFNLHAEYNHVKCRARCSTSWNQDFQKKYQ